MPRKNKQEKDVRRIALFFWVITCLQIQEALATPVFIDGSIESSLCQRQKNSSIKDALAAYPEKEIEKIIIRAEAGSVDSMFLLSLLPRKKSDGTRDEAFTEYWRNKALVAGHPTAKFYAAKSAFISNKKTQSEKEELLALAEQAANESGGDLAYELGSAYAMDGPLSLYNLTNGDPAKALYWTRLAAERGNAAAAENLCLSYFNSDTNYGVKKDYVEARRWCVISAQAECSYHSPSRLSQIFRDGLGVPRNLLEAQYWDYVSHKRFERAISR